MVDIYTLPVEFYDGDGDGNDRDIAFLERAGQMRIRDKVHEGERYVSPKPVVVSHIEAHPSHSQFDADQKARLEAHRQRIVVAERVLRSKGINPCRMNTAGKFDALKG